VTLPDLRFAAAIAADWEWVNRHWINLLQSDPVAPINVEQ
jgi:hypothetical protein